MSLIPEIPGGAEWTPADDLAAASEEQAKLRIYDAAYKADYLQPDDDATKAAKGFLAGLGLSLPLWVVVACALWWGLA